MARWATFFVFVFIMGALISSMMDTQAVYAVSRLDGAITAESVTITVTGIETFPGATATDGGASLPATGRRVYVGDEVVQWTSIDLDNKQFLGVSRGVADPQTGHRIDPVAHSSGTRVKSLSAQSISSVHAINIISSGASFGSIAGYVLTGKVFEDLFKLIAWDYAFLDGKIFEGDDGGGIPLIYFKLPLFALSAGFLWGIAFAMQSLAQGVFRVA